MTLINKLVDRICQLWLEQMGCEGNSAMIHKWVVEDKGYEGPNPQPEFMVNFYKTALAELQANEGMLKCIIRVYFALEPPAEDTKAEETKPEESAPDEHIEVTPPDDVVHCTPMLTSGGIFNSSSKVEDNSTGITKQPTIKDEKKAFDFSGLDDMDDMLMDEIDSDDDKDQEQEDEVFDIVKKFHSQNQNEKKANLFDDLTPTADIDSKKLVRSFTSKIDDAKGSNKNLFSEIDILRTQLKQANEEIEKYHSFILQIQKAVSWSNVDMSQARVHMSFLFASPLLRKIKDGYENVMLLDYMSEIRDIESNLKNVNYEIKYNKNVATQRNFHSVVSDRPIVLHFSGHGVINDQQSLGSDYTFHKDKGNMLLLEDDHGMSNYLFERDLKSMINMMDAKFEVVFIASCHSEFAGHVFHNAGARHVICIRGSEKISDEATLKFAQIFYEMLFVKQYSPCKAFEITKEQIKRVNFESEANKFVLVYSEYENGKKHECKPLINFTYGKFTNLTKEPELSVIPAAMKDLKGRQREMYDIILLLKDFRLLILQGISGMGKTSLLKNLCNHIKHRGIFRNGIVYINCKEFTNSAELIASLALSFQRVLGKLNFG